MTNGELLHKLQQSRGLPVGPWETLNPQWQSILETVATEFLQAADPRTLGPQWAVRVWKTELQKYGHHLPTCPIGAPCSCGFAEVEKELAQP